MSGPGPHGPASRREPAVVEPREGEETWEERLARIRAVRDELCSRPSSAPWLAYRGVPIYALEWGDLARIIARVHGDASELEHLELEEEAA